MAKLRIEGMPTELYEKLWQRAAKNSRTIADEVISLLEQVLAEPQRTLYTPRKPPQAVKGAFPLTDAWLEQAKRTGRS